MTERERRWSTEANPGVDSQYQEGSTETNSRRTEQLNDLSRKLRENRSKSVEEFDKLIELSECPLSLDRIKEPKVDKYGDVYESEYIRHAVESNPISPLTRLPLTSDDITKDKAFEGVLYLMNIIADLYKEITIRAKIYNLKDEKILEKCFDEDERHLQSLREENDSLKKVVLNELGKLEIWYKQNNTDLKDLKKEIQTINGVLIDKGLIIDDDLEGGRGKKYSKKKKNGKNSKKKNSKKKKRTRRKR